jgi:death-on-curing protein
VTAYLDIEDALQPVDRAGFHIRDIGLLASTLVRPATTIMGTEAYPGEPLKVAVLLDSAARFHPLIDGNKRTAWLLTVWMLWINGYAHNFTEQDSFNPVVGVAAGKITPEEDAARIARHMVPR